MVTGGTGEGSATAVPDRPIRVLLVDDQELVRAGFRMVLDATDGIEVVGEAGDGQAALDLLSRTAVDVVLMDIRMPRMDGVTATREICSRLPDDAAAQTVPRVVVLTTFDLDEYAFAALQAGASGFLLKDAGPADLLSAIRAVHRGDSVIAPSTTRRLLAHFGDALGAATGAGPGDQAVDRAEAPGAPPARGVGHPRLAPLTAREVEVLTAVGLGMTNAEIAASHFLAEATVKTHIGRVLHKLQLRDRVQMVMLAYETGLVEVASAD